MTTETTPHRSAPEWPWHLAVLAFLVGWWLVCRQLVAVSEALTSLLPVERRSHAGEAIAVFL